MFDGLPQGMILLLADERPKIFSMDGKVTRGTTDENRRSSDVLVACDENTAYKKQRAHYGHPIQS